MRLTHLYAEALFQSIEEEEKALAILSEGQELQKVLAAFPEFTEWLDLHPDAFPIIGEPLRTKFSDILLNFLEVLTQDGLLHDYESVIQAYQLILVEEDLLYDIKIESAKELSQELKERLTALIEKRWGDSYFLSYEVKPDLIHGLKMTVNNAIIDTSIQSRLDAIRKGV